ncbi:hypothetical protein ABZ876_35570 [Streptomyces sp. NPDC046931]|uniref:hypothetical protein n=1 Tax=Streptomyces sp. NPDC046931 TaxID=3154806 RepID=UPI0033E652F5
MTCGYGGVQVTAAYVDIHQGDPGQRQRPRPARLPQRNSLFGTRQRPVVLLQVTQDQR